MQLIEIFNLILPLPCFNRDALVLQLQPLHLLRKMFHHQRLRAHQQQFQTQPHHNLNRDNLTRGRGVAQLVVNILLRKHLRSCDKTQSLHTPQNDYALLKSPGTPPHVHVQTNGEGRLQIPKQQITTRQIMMEIWITRFPWCKKRKNGRMIYPMT